MDHHVEGDPFCEKCGAKAIVTCPSCEARIRGKADVTWMAADAVGPYSVPAFCPECGKPFPWTERRIEAALEAIEEEDSFTQEQKVALKNDIEDIVGDTPRAQNAAKRMKAALLKVGGTVGAAVRELLVEIAGETAKRILSGP